jgi:hypothetical protein
MKAGETTSSKFLHRQLDDTDNSPHLAFLRLPCLPLWVTRNPRTPSRLRHPFSPQCAPGTLPTFGPVSVIVFRNRNTKEADADLRDLGFLQDLADSD